MKAIVKSSCLDSDGDAWFSVIRKIAFEDVLSKGIIQRAWEGLIPNRILIYCL